MSNDSPPTVMARRRGVRWLVCCAMIAAASLLLPVWQQDFFRCAVCGMGRCETRIAGHLLQTSDEATACSEWYQRNVEPHHTHVWVRGTWQEQRGLLGVPNLDSNRFYRSDGPVVFLGSAAMKFIYEHSSDPRAARDVFLRLAQWDNTAEGREQQWQLLRRLESWAWNPDGPPPLGTMPEPGDHE